jgi:hypothetical protein
MSDAPHYLPSRCANCNFVIDVNFMSSLCNPSIERDKARVTEFLSYGATRAEAAEF